MKLPPLNPTSDAGRSALSRIAGDEPQVAAPTAELEEWRYSRLPAALAADAEWFGAVPGPADQSQRPAVREQPGGSAESGVLSQHVADGIDWIEATLTLIDGRLAGEPTLPDGVVLGDPGAVAGSLGNAGDDWFTELNAAGSPAPVVLEVGRSVRVGNPIVVVSEAQMFSCPHLVLVAGENSEVELIEIIRGSAGSVTVTVTEVLVGAGAHVRHSSVQEVSTEAVVVGRQIVDVGRDASVDVVHGALGGRDARMRFDCRLAGRGAHGSLTAVYVGSGNQELDLRTFQHHLAPDTTSTLAFKGAVADTAHSIYTGLIRIAEEAPRVVAAQSNRVIKLSDGAWAESVPNLEIDNNDVSCSHASAVGPVDAEQRFYLESRGIAPATAEKLVVRGFLRDSVEAFHDERVRRHVAERCDAEIAALDVRVEPAITGSQHDAASVGAASVGAASVGAGAVVSDVGAVDSDGGA